MTLEVQSATTDTRSTSRLFQKWNGKDEHEKQVGEDRLGLSPSKTIRFQTCPMQKAWEVISWFT